MKLLGGSLLAVTAIALLAGCTPTTSPTPTPSTSTTSSIAPSAPPTVTPTPSPTASPEAAAIVISGANLVIADAEGEAIETIPFTSSPAAVITTLSEIVGTDPVRSKTPSGYSCAPVHSEATWDDRLTVSWGKDLTRATGAKFVVKASSATVGDGISLETPTGFSVGDSSKDLLDVPGTYGYTNGDKSNGWTDVYYDPTAGSKDDIDAWAGAFASGKAEKGAITSLISPVEYIAFINQCG